MPDMRAAHGAARTGHDKLVIRPARGSVRPSDHEMTVQQPAEPAPRRPAPARVAMCACLVVLGGLGLQACGGGSVSESVPKSTPNIVPPSDTSAEKAALSTTSTSTTSTSKTSTSGGETTSTGSSSESAGSESSEAPSSGGTSEAGSSGGSSAGSEKASTPEASSKSTEATGGASAP